MFSKFSFSQLSLVTDTTCTGTLDEVSVYLSLLFIEYEVETSGLVSKVIQKHRRCMQPPSEYLAKLVKLAKLC